MYAKPLPDKEFLESILIYNPETGVLHWKNREFGWSGFNGRFGGKEAFTYETEKGYRRGRLLGRLVMAHRVIWKMTHGNEADEIDHINGIRNDNRICNLRSVDRSQNMRNACLPSCNTTGTLGVYKGHTRGKWAAGITIKKKFVSLGTFNSKADALAARKAAEKEHGYHPNHGRKNA